MAVAYRDLLSGTACGCAELPDQLPGGCPGDAGAGLFGAGYPARQFGRRVAGCRLWRDRFRAEQRGLHQHAADPECAAPLFTPLKLVINLIVCV